MAIEYRRLGKNGVLVSNICLGTMNFGWYTSEKDSFRIMDRALELGINFFDTADVYGWGGEHGDTELIIGRWFSSGNGRRQAVVLATKVYNPVKRKENKPEPNTDTRCLSAMKIKKHCENSLKRLQTDWIDLYQMHHIDRNCSWDEIWQAFGSLICQGKIVYAGSSNFAGWDIATACQEAWKRNLTGLVSEQSVYNLINRTVELEVLPACQYYGLGFIPYSPLAGGLLAGIEGKAVGRRSNQGLLKTYQEKQHQIERFEKLCRKIGEEPAMVALAWLMHSSVVTAPIIGPRTVQQLENAVRATDIKLDGEVLKELDKIFPGPGEAPESYAW